MGYTDLLQNDLLFLKSLHEAEIPKKTIETARAQLVPTPESQIETHYRLFELINMESILKEKHLDNSLAAKTLQTVKELYIEAIPQLVCLEDWN